MRSDPFASALILSRGESKGGKAINGSPWSHQVKNVSEHPFIYDQALQMDRSVGSFRRMKTINPHKARFSVSQNMVGLQG